MKKLLQNDFLRNLKISSFAFAFTAFSLSSAIAQCTVTDGQISGQVYLDVNANGVNDDDEFLSGILVNAFDNEGQLADHAMSNILGNYTLENLDPSKTYRVEFKHAPTYYSTRIGADHKTAIRHEIGATCNINFGLVTEESLLGDNPNIAVTCFVQGDNDTNDNLETIVGIESQFFSSSNSSTSAFPILNKAATGSIWGLAFDKKSQNLYSSAFIKQYAKLGPAGYDAIYKTSFKTTPYSATLFAKLSELGINMPALVNTNINDCLYGTQAGKKGLGAIELSPDGKFLYVVNITNNSIVKISTSNPTAATTTEISIPQYSGTNSQLSDYPAYPFAIKFYNDKLYIGATITGEDPTNPATGNTANTVGYIWEMELDNQQFDLVFETNYLQGPWNDLNFSSYEVQQWLTDIDFIEDDFMIIGLSDRKGHKFCKTPSNRLDDQKGDILAVYKNGLGVWTLEQNAVIFENQMGSGRDNGDGPKDENNVRGEFFGHDFFPKDPLYHDEVVLGSFTVLQNTKEVVAATFDPYWTTYSGGLQRYSSENGAIAGVGNNFTGAKDLYLDNSSSLFGKATGFGDVVVLSPNPGLEIGNVVWIDANDNGVQDPNETVLSNVEISLYDSNCTKIGETTTNADGNYAFNENNVDSNGDNIMDGLDANTQYFIVLTDVEFSKANGAFNYEGENLVVAKLNLGHASNPDETDNDAEIATDICSLIDGFPVIAMSTAGLGDNNHAFDFGFTSPGIFDLALKKEIVGTDLVRMNDKILYKITVINQGNVGAKNIVIQDLIPVGMRHEAGNNANWSISGNAATYTIPALAAGTQTEIFINLFINGGFTYDQFINYAEIVEAQNQFGLPGQDVDSTPDNNFDNDEGGVPFQVTDNEVDDNGDIDEDDHDPAAVRVFDLALTKKLVNVQSTYIEGDYVDFEIYVWNQGNTVAKDVTITDYVPEGLEIDNSDGSWVYNNGFWQSTIPTVGIGQRITVPVRMYINNVENEESVVNVAEISSAFMENGEVGVDFDSTPNTNQFDDKGGDPNGATDDEQFDDGQIDEDDQDPAIFYLARYDLALIKTTNSGSVQAGSIVDFDITVINQGSIVADRIQVVDYIPEGLEFLPENTDWTLNADGNAVILLSVLNNRLSNSGLVPEQEITTSIKLRVKEDVEPGQLVNYAEISGSYDMAGNNRSNDDFDSTPDFILNNDNGGIAFSAQDNQVNDDGLIDEDDQDPAALIVFDFGLENGCFCFANAENGGDGQYGQSLYIISEENERWTVVSATGIQQGNGSATNAPDFDAYTIGEQIPTVPFPTGITSDSLAEVNFGPISQYLLEGIYVDGASFSVTLTNGVEEILIEANGCSYADQSIIGAAGVCAGSTATYCAENTSGTEYLWNLSGGGVINGLNNQECVSITFDAAPGGPFTLTVENNNAGECIDAASLEIQSGIAGGAMACIGNATVSLDSDCEMEVIPSMVLQGTPPVDVVYLVSITDAQGNMLPKPILTYEHIGQSMIIKVMDVCTGNSCWTTMTVDDKLAPEILVEDVTVNCNQLATVGMPSAIDNCGGPAPVVELTGESFDPQSCNPDFTNIITRTFIATDNQGNVSDPVDQQIFLQRIIVADIVFPAAMTVQNGNPIYCQQFDTDENGNPAPSSTGVPTYQGEPIFPYQDEFCNFGITYSDQVFQPGGCVEKVMRTWTVAEWYCSTSIFDTYIQEINIADQFAPTFTAPANFTVTTNTGQCQATVTLPAVLPTDDCSETFEVDIQYPGGFLNNSNGGSVDLPLGESMITYTVYDACLNSSSQSFSVTVMDATPPVMVCDGNTVISLKADGTAYAPAIVFDDGTVEDCSPYILEVRRMDNGAACAINNNNFGPIVEFCCADVGNAVQVILRATDEDGNMNECMVNVVVQDKNPPVITVPADLTIQCTTVFDPENLDAFFGSATASDNCQVTGIEEIANISINECQTGTIVRTFIASDGNGTDVGTQTITVENNSMFAESDIVWPLDFSTDAGCNAGDLSPENLDPPFDYPTITVDECDMVSVNYTDQTFSTTDNGACLKIIRTFMVMNMCDLDMNSNPKVFTHQQTIVVTNSVAPVINSSCEPVSSSQDATCDDGFITLSASATDDCTPINMLQNSYNIDLNNDGSFDISQMGSGGTISYSGTLPIGSHRIIYQFEDRCGNSATCTQEFTIFNEIAPLAYCTNLNVELTPMDTDGDNIFDSEMAFVDVVLIGGNSEHPCGYPIELSYDIAGDSTIAVFDCFDLGINYVTVYVTDTFGNQSSCVAEIEIQDNNTVDICPTVEDCIMWPDTNLLVTDCVANLDPETIMSFASVELPCVCDDFDIVFNDVDVSNAQDACATIERTWEISFNCFSNPMVFTFEQKITQQNAFPPIIGTCPADGSGMSTNAACTANVVLGIPTVEGVGTCTTGITITNDSPFADSNTGAATGDYPVGTTTVIYTVTDACGNASTCTLDVVVDDLGAPICSTQDITVTIPSDGSPVTIAGNAVDNGSTDDCGMIVLYEVTPDTFDCGNSGDNTVVMTVTDQSGNTSTCTAIVTVEDEVAPICSAGSLTITLFANTTVTITGQQLDNGSIDTCGTIVSYTATPNMFDCDDVGINDVILTVTDNFGNSSTCATTVTILDGVDPLCATQDITITLDATGNYTLAASEVDNGSSDICGDMISLSVTPNMFTCDDLGENTVTLTVTDAAGNTSECTAIVTVTENVAPICMAGTANITLFTTTSIAIPASFVDNGSFDECGEIDTIFITPNVFGCDDIGSNIVILTVVDDSGNSSTCEGTVNVTDNVAPMCITQDITINIEADGTTTVPGIDIDNGSTDACGVIVSYEITPSDFTCDDEGDNVVVFTATDNSGNTCTSTATVTVLNMDELMCVTQDLTIYLDENGEAFITAEDVDNGTMAPCGTTVSISISDGDFFCNDSQTNPNTIMFFATDDDTGEVDTCFSDITVLDTILPVVICPVDMTFDCNQDLSDESIFGIVSFTDNCQGGLMMDTIVVANVNTCGIGTITRTYVAADLSGNTGTCVQTITVESAPGMSFSEDNIMWPDTFITVVDCSMTTPEELGSFPVIIDTMGLTCFTLSIDYLDMSVGMGTMCLDTIQRTWTVIDSCQLDGSGAGIFTFDQFLFIDDSDIPEIMGIPTDTTVFSSADSCNVFVDLSAVFVEDCSQVITATNDSPFSASPTSLDASGSYPLGTTDVEITSLDACGNADTFNISITVIDTIKPVFACVKTFNDITDNGTVTIQAIDVVQFLSDNCTDSINMTPLFILNFDETDTDPTDNATSPSMTFDCDQLGISIVYLIVYDESGNFSFCAAQAAIEDPNEFCGPTPPSSNVSGSIDTYYGENIKKTEISLTGNNDQETLVDENGNYSFTDVYGLGVFNITPYNNNEPAKGITTLDILVIQKHIMDMDALDNQYDMIAADANKSGDITGADIIVLQKLILGEYQEFPNNTSFRFVPKEFEFMSNEPFSMGFPESDEIIGITSNTSSDFYGIKIGDVNGSYEGLGTDGDETEVIVNPEKRNVSHELYMKQGDLKSIDGFVEIPVYSPSFEALQAMEMTLRSQGVEFISIKPGLIDVAEADFSIKSFGRALKLSWINTVIVNVAEGDRLFSLIVRSDKALNASDVILMTKGTNEFYKTNYDIADLKLATTRSTVDQPMVTLNQNTPNPFTNVTTISFDMFKDADYTINFFNTDGKLLSSISGDAVAGYNSVSVSKEDLGVTSGVIIYEFLSENRKIVKRMMLID